MAKLKRTHSRAPGSMDGGASWISYSDMMAAMLLVFVLILCYSLYQYFLMLETKTAELAQQQTTLVAQETQLASQQKTLAERESELRSAQAALIQQQIDLDAAKAKLAEQEEDLLSAQALLQSQQTQLDAATTLVSAQQQTLDEQQSKLDTILGIRTRIISDLSQTLAKENLKATVDQNTGDIVVESAVFFDSGNATIKESGKALLDSFIPVYLSVLMRPEYSDYLGSIIIEGHTDSKGEFLMNLDLSQRRAFSVVEYCLQMNGLSADMRLALQDILTATGRSYSAPIYLPNGEEDMERSRRVEFKFKLKDAEMITEMNRILSQ